MCSGGRAEGRGGGYCVISSVLGPGAPFLPGECPTGQAPAGVTRDCRDLLWEGLLALPGQWPVLKSWEGMRERILQTQSWPPTSLLGRRRGSGGGGGRRTEQGARRCRPRDDGVSPAAERCPQSFAFCRCKHSAHPRGPGRSGHLSSSLCTNPSKLCGLRARSDPALLVCSTHTRHPLCFKPSGAAQSTPNDRPPGPTGLSPGSAREPDSVSSHHNLATVPLFLRPFLPEARAAEGKVTAPSLPSVTRRP